MKPSPRSLALATIARCAWRFPGTVLSVGQLLFAVSQLLAYRCRSPANSHKSPFDRDRQMAAGGKSPAICAGQKATIHHSLAISRRLLAIRDRQRASRQRLPAFLLQSPAILLRQKAAGLQQPAASEEKTLNSAAEPFHRLGRAFPMRLLCRPSLSRRMVFGGRMIRVLGFVTFRDDTPVVAPLQAMRLQEYPRQAERPPLQLRHLRATRPPPHLFLLS